MSSIDTIIPFISKKLNKRLTNREINLIRDNFIQYDPQNITELKTLVDYLIVQITQTATKKPTRNLEHFDINPSTPRALLDTSNPPTSNTSHDLPKDPLMVQQPIDDMREYTKSIISTTAEDGQLNQYRYNDRLTNYNTQINKKLSVNISLLLQMQAANLFKLSAQLNPSSKEVYSYITLDTDNLLEYDSSGTTTVFKWLINNNAPPVLSRGYINLHSTMFNIKRIRLARTIFSYMHEIDYDSLMTERIAFSIEEFGSQALLNPGGIKFHFLQKYFDNWGNTITTSSFLLNRGWFRFREPHLPIESITLRIYDLFPIRLITLPNTPFSVTGVQSVQYFQQTTLPKGTIDNALIITDYKFFDIIATAYPNEGTARQQYLISGYTTDDPVADAALIAAYNGVRTLEQFQAQRFERPNNADVLSGTWDPATASVNITITWLYNPRITTVIELVNELPEGEKLT